MATYVFTNSDITYNFPSGVVGKLNGNIINVGDTATTGDVITIECGDTKKIRVINGNPFCQFQNSSTGELQKRFSVS